MYHPDLLTTLDGSPVASPADWRVRRGELLSIIDREQYGIQPDFSGKAQGTVDKVDDSCCAGRAKRESLRIAFDTPSGSFAFPLQFVYPADEGPHPLILLLNFDKDLYGPFCPVEEIIDNGFALGYIYYQDITSDDGDMSSGLAGCYPRKDPNTDWGKLSMWAFAASRALDYLLTRPEVDPRNSAVIGHSRLGKAALLCGAHDERFRFTIANDSGCGGAALEQTKHEGAETYAHMKEAFPFWFCANRHQYADSQANMPYDQHFLLAAIAPRYVALGGAAQDAWADPYSEQLCCLAASPAWALHDMPGFAGPSSPVAIGTAYHDGAVGYHLRQGVHYLSRQDWLQYMAFIKRHLHKGA